MQVKWTHFETNTDWSLVLKHKDHSSFKNAIMIIKLTQLLVSSSAASESMIKPEKKVGVEGTCHLVQY